jgi:hypothetical protein
MYPHNIPNTVSSAVSHACEKCIVSVLTPAHIHRNPISRKIDCVYMTHYNNDLCNLVKNF